MAALKVERGAKQEYVDEHGTRYFSVSQVRQCIHDGTRGIPPDVLEVARKRGTILHQRFWRLLASRVKLVDPPAIVPGLEGFCHGMDEWAETHQVEPVALESMVVSTKYGYAGTLDAVVCYGRGSWQVLMDLKTGQRSPTDIMQLLAYEQAREEVDGKRPHGGSRGKLLDLYLFKNGSVVENWVTAKDKLNHFPCFLNALSILRWRLAHGA